MVLRERNHTGAKDGRQDRREEITGRVTEAQGLPFRRGECFALPKVVSSLNCTVQRLIFFNDRTSSI